MSISQNMRDEFARKRTTRDGKLARVFAHPSQVERDGHNIVVNPPGEDSLARARREARESRAAADAAKA